MQVQQYTCVFSEKGKTRTSQKLRDRIVPISISSFHLLSPFSSSIFFFLPFPIFHHSSSFFSSFLPPLCYSSSFLLFFLFFILFCCFFFLSFPWNKHMPAILFSPLTALSLQILQAFIEYYIQGSFVQSQNRPLQYSLRCLLACTHCCRTNLCFVYT